VEHIIQYSAHKHFLAFFRQSGITGLIDMNLFIAVTKLVKDPLLPYPEINTMVRAALDTLHLHKYNVPDLTNYEVYKEPTNMQASAGLHEPIPDDLVITEIPNPELQLPIDVLMEKLDDPVFCAQPQTILSFAQGNSTTTTTTPKKEQVFLSVRRQLALNIKNHSLPEPIYIMRLKTEILPNPNKSRLFYNPPLFKYLLERAVFEPLLRQLQAGPFLIGFTWARSGCKKLLDHMDYKKRYHWFIDYSNYDQSIRSALLKALVEYLTSKIERHEYNADYIEYILQWLAEKAATKIVQWIIKNTWRKLLGILPSGDYLTIILTSLTNYLLTYTYFEYVRQQTNIMIDFKQLIVGDDVWISLPLHLQDTLNLYKDLKVMSFARFVRERFLIVVKSDSVQTTNIISLRDPQTHELTHRGPLFLKHYFVKHDDELIVPYRDPQRLIARTFRTTMDLRDPGDAYPRFVAAMWSTLGTNKALYNVFYRSALATRPFYSPEKNSPKGKFARRLHRLPRFPDVPEFDHIFRFFNQETPNYFPLISREPSNFLILDLDFDEDPSEDSYFY
jgi:hypothetical protein